MYRIRGFIFRKTFVRTSMIIVCFACISVSSLSILVSNTIFYLLDCLCVRYQYRYWYRIYFSTYRGFW